ncbi:hypothetical protein ACJDU8_24045 [Clostridium sp. WILCCON 0269]|uniref:Transcriptional regulator n=1 Tax=Candidatus Clostridium eludens TaxID=3381663 RepID=A0ABW8SSH9_9CLOT
MTNESVKNKLKDYLVKNGVRNNFVAEKIGLSCTSICLFLKGRRLLLDKKLKLIEGLINKTI